MPHAIMTSRAPSPSAGHGAAIARSNGGRPFVIPSELRETIRELDAWCRTHGWSTNLNAWIAEEAVRRS